MNGKKLGGWVIDSHLNHGNDLVVVVVVCDCCFRQIWVSHDGQEVVGSGYSPGIGP